MDIGVYWSSAVLEHKLERQDHEGRVEEVWNVRRLPQGLGNGPGPDRLFVAVGKHWRGFFHLVPEVLYSPEDPACPYALIFDAKSWTQIHKTVPCRPFRGWTYDVPPDLVAAPLSPPPSRSP